MRDVARKVEAVFGVAVAIIVGWCVMMLVGATLGAVWLFQWASR